MSEEEIGEEFLIRILDLSRKSKEKHSIISAYFIGHISGSGISDLTHIWNLAVLLAEKENITVYEMNLVWDVLDMMRQDGIITLSNLT